MIDITQIKVGDNVKFSPLSKTVCTVLSVNDKTKMIKVRFIDENGKPCEIEYFQNELHPLEIAGEGTMPANDKNIEYIMADGGYFSAPCRQVAKLVATADFQRKYWQNFTGSDNRTPILVFDNMLTMKPLDEKREAELKALGNYEKHYAIAYNKLLENYNL